MKPVERPDMFSSVYQSFQTSPGTKILNLPTALSEPGPWSVAIDMQLKSSIQFSQRSNFSRQKTLKHIRMIQKIRKPNQISSMCS